MTEAGTTFDFSRLTFSPSRRSTTAVTEPSTRDLLGDLGRRGLSAPVPLDVRPFPATLLIPAGTRPLLTSARSARTFQYGPSARRHLQHNRHPDRSPQVRTITVPESPPRLHTGLLGGYGRHPPLRADPTGMPHAVRVPRYPGLASGFLQTPPHDDALASGSELAPPLPPGDFHPQAIAHAGRTTPHAPGDTGGVTD